MRIVSVYFASNFAAQTAEWLLELGENNSAPTWPAPPPPPRTEIYCALTTPLQKMAVKINLGVIFKQVWVRPTTSFRLSDKIR